MRTLRQNHAKNALRSGAAALLLQALCSLPLVARGEAADLHFWVKAPALNQGAGCYDTTGTPLTDLAAIQIRGVRFSDLADTLYGQIDAHGKEGDSLAFDITGVAPGSMGYVWTYAFDTSGNGSCIGAQNVWALPYTETLGTPGLSAVYYDNTDFSGTTVTAIDSLINFSTALSPNWPGSVVGPGKWAARWTGYIATPAGMLTFCTDCHDGSRLWVDGFVVIDHWGANGPSKPCGMIGLTQGQHTIKLEYMETAGLGRISLLWTVLGGTEAPVPASALEH